MVWALLVVTYVLGAGATARVVLTGGSSGQGHATSAAEIALWPLYWVGFLLLLYRGRRR